MHAHWNSLARHELAEYSHLGRVWIEDLRIGIPYKVFEFGDPVGPGELLGPFHIAMNYPGICPTRKPLFKKACEGTRLAMDFSEVPVACADTEWLTNEFLPAVDLTLQASAPSIVVLPAASHDEADFLLNRIKRRLRDQGLVMYTSSGCHRLIRRWNGRSSSELRIREGDFSLLQKGACYSSAAAVISLSGS